MKRNYGYALNFALVWAILLIGVFSVFSQRSFDGFAGISQELRPFDFSDKFYQENGIEPELIVNRRDGMDKQSVADTIDDPRFRNVRILSVFGAYNQEGKIFYWNLYGEFSRDAFRVDAVGERAAQLAHLYPLYIFPSINKETEFRQAHLINLRDEGYFEKNALGLSVQVVVEFTDRINTDDGRREMEALAQRNGYSGDGTPIIKTALEIEELTQKNYVTQKIKSLYDPAKPPYAIAKVMPNPLYGAIAPDAFLLNNLGLKAEQNFVRQFECLQIEGKWCGR
jgi:hypothetical protein